VTDAMGLEIDDDHVLSTAVPHGLFWKSFKVKNQSTGANHTDLMDSQGNK
jgi:hypothetical protein